MRESSKRSSTMRSHPVDLGADLAVVAGRVVGHPVLERLGHRPQPGQRRAQVVGHPGDQLAARLLEPLLAVARLLQPFTAVAASSSLTARGAPRAVAQLGLDHRPLSPSRRASSRRRRDHRRAPCRRRARRPRTRRRPPARPEHDAEVVVGQEHRSCGADDAGHDASTTATTATSADLPAERAAAQRATPTPAARAGRRRPRPGRRR